MNASIDWDDLALVLAIVRGGTLGAAAATLGVHHSTAFRRLQRVEERAGTALFHRTPQGYVPTETGAVIGEHAARVEDELLGVQRALEVHDRVPRGRIRLTTVPSLVAPILPALQRLSEQCPELHIELDATPDTRSLERGDADLALRPTAEPPGELVGTRLTTLGWATYRRKVGKASPSELRYVGPLATQEDDRGGAAGGTKRRASVSVTTVPAMTACIVAGLGAGRLPCYVGDVHPKLTRVGPVQRTSIGLWLLSPAALRKSARVQATRTRLVTCLTPELQRFTGEAPR
ncbi:MAG: LysR family transcriptional regulator [Polyangiales bacterium]|nr:LysR family transcriptional regulator [Myxococcales bacterium]